MHAQRSTLDAGFIRKQGEYLRKLREELLAAVRTDEDDEDEIRRESGGAHEYEDEGQKLAQLEVDGNRVARSLQRLKGVERALEKIEEGSYGISDVSGEPIPRERLEAAPEAICNLDESKVFRARP